MNTDLLALSNQLADLVAGAAPSVVQVQGRRRPASGIVFDTGLVLTTTRALGREDGLAIRTADGTSSAAEVAGWDPATGLVLLRAASAEAPPATPRVEPARVGHLVAAIGRSWSNALTATHGLVSVIGGPLPTGPGRSIEQVIRTTAPMHGGFAGGGLFDMTGRLVGLTTAVMIRGLAVVIPTDIAWSVARRLAEHGTVPRAYLGLAGQTVKLAPGQRGVSDRERGVLVVSVMAGSPAETGGILVGDVILSFDGQSIQTPIDLLELLESDRVGRRVEVQLVRGGAPVTVPVVVGTRGAD